MISSKHIFKKATYPSLTLYLLIRYCTARPDTYISIPPTSSETNTGFENTILCPIINFYHYKDQ